MGVFWTSCVEGNLFQGFFVTTSLILRWINVFLFFYLGLKSGFLKFMITVYMFGCYLKTWVHLTFCFYFATRKKCVNMNAFLKWKLSRWINLSREAILKWMGSRWNELKKDFTQFFHFCRSEVFLSGIHRIEAQKETNFKMNSLISEAAP